MNLFLHGAHDFKIMQGDTLRQPSFVAHGKLQTFNCVLANPPFSLEKWGSTQFESDKYGRNLWGCPSDSSADFAWLQHMVKSMDPKSGKCAVVLPQGVLFHGGKEGKMREQLVESDMLECVITLVSGVFYSTGVSACILFLNNKKSVDHRGRVCLIDASNIYTPQRAQNIMTDDDIQKVFDLYQAYNNKIDYSKVVTKDDIRKAGYTLAVGTYIEKSKQEITPPAEVRKQYFEAIQSVRENEAILKKLLAKGGYINEQ
jgi:type I restriction enzyme M protein